MFGIGVWEWAVEKKDCWDWEWLQNLPDLDRCSIRSQWRVGEQAGKAGKTWADEKKDHRHGRKKCQALEACLVTWERKRKLL